MLNQIRAQLRMQRHPNPRLQRDWDTQGPDVFVFEVFDTLPPKDDPGYEPTDDLQTLKELWLERLALATDVAY